MGKKISTDQVNHLNILLMVISAGLAMHRPFETFLIAYAFLGPLHYLTEISWLHDRKYFTRASYDRWVLFVLIVLVSCARGGWVPGLTPTLFGPLLMITFVTALVFAFVGTPRRRLFAAVLLIPPCLLASPTIAVSTMFGTFLPTLIHVFLFTGLFISVGALKSRSATGLASLAVFVACGAVFFISPPSRDYSQAADVQKIYYDFSVVNYSFLSPLATHDFTVPDNIRHFGLFIRDVLYQSSLSIGLMGFIAFAYLYHYLNWFSKTSIIQWHAVSAQRLIAIVAIWILSVGLYVHDYHMGLEWLSALSLAHVVLEFPLNHLTFVTVGKELRTALQSSSSAESARSRTIVTSE